MVLEFSGGICIVKEAPEGLMGFVSGFLEPAKFYQDMRRKPFDLYPPILYRLLTRPWLLPRLLASHSQARRSSQSAASESCELSSIAVGPCWRGHGVGKGLLRAFMSAVNGHTRYVTLTTDVHGNDVVNSFYQDFGFHKVGVVERSKGRSLNEYRYEISEMPHIV